MKKFIEFIITSLILIIMLIVSIVLLPFRLLFFLLGINFQEEKTSHLQETEDIKENDEGEIFHINYDNLNEEEKLDVQKAILEKTDFPKFIGEVKHAYELVKVKNSKICPRCQMETTQSYANFIYATQIALRAMFVPAGFFCKKCPTVIIDQKMIQEGISENFKFQGILGIDYEEKEEPDFFETWNGKQAIYILDEEQNVLRLTDLISLNPSENKKQKKRKEKLAKQSKRKNRKKKK